jgi:hypothetical protein
MSDSDDLYDVTRPPISDELAEQLLSGSHPDGDAGPVAGLDAVFSALRAPAEASELTGLDAAIEAFQGAVVTPIAGPTTARTTRPMLKKLLSTKAIVALGAVTLASAGAAAAATGTVPSPFASDRAQEVTAERVPDVARENVAKHLDDESETESDVEPDVEEETGGTGDSTGVVGVVGVSTEADATADDSAVEEASDEEASADAAATTEAVGPDATGPAKFGLCNAFAERLTPTEPETPTDPETPTTSTHMPIAARNLSEAAAAAGQTVEEFCADATPGRSSEAPGQSETSPSATAPGQTGERPSATAPGQTGERPSATAPGQTGERPSATAPGQTGERPSATAPGQVAKTSSGGGGGGNGSANANGAANGNGKP